MDKEHYEFRAHWIGVDPDIHEFHVLYIEKDTPDWVKEEGERAPQFRSEAYWDYLEERIGNFSYNEASEAFEDDGRNT
jgi:hypothetical protein